MSSAIERLEAFANWCEEAKVVKSRTEFEKVCGLSRGYIRNSILLRTASVGSDMLANIYAQFPFLSLTWVVTGNGNMIANANSEGDSAYEVLKEGFAKYRRIKEIIEENSAKFPQKKEMKTKKT